MNSAALDIVAEEIGLLRSDFSATFASATDACRENGALWSGIDDVIVIGQGDSFHAGIIASSVFHSLAGVSCRPVLSYSFGLQPELWLRRPASTLVIAVSASGATRSTLEALSLAMGMGARSIGLSGCAEAPLSQLAEMPLTVQLSGKRKSPGIRSFQASLSGLLAVAIRLGTRTGRLTPLAEDELVRQAFCLGDVVGRNADFAEKISLHVAAAIDDAPALMFAASGATHGVALHAAAKTIETAGLVAVGQDLEEWWHVERFAGGASIPLVVIAPSDSTRARALDLIRQTRALQRQVFVVAAFDDDEAAVHAQYRVSLDLTAPQPFRVFTMHPFAAWLAHAIATRRGTEPFAFGRPTI